MITLQAVLEQLTQENHLTPEGADQIHQRLAAEAAQQGLPWYIQAAIGLSAWVAAVPLVGFIGTFSSLGQGVGLMVVGVIFCLIATTLRYTLPPFVFVTQATLAMNLAGQMLFMGGLAWLTENITLVSLVFIIIQLMVIVVYPDGVQRFISTFLIPFAVAAILADGEILHTLHVVVLGVAGFMLVGWEADLFLACHFPSETYRPVLYGLTVSFMVLLLGWFENVIDETSIYVGYWWLSSVGLLFSLLLLEYFILTTSPGEAAWPVVGLVLSLTALLLLPVIQAPGIIAAMLILALGYQRGNIIILGLATAFLAVFIIGFYYQLHLTLLTKSIMLMGTGLAFLVAYLLLSRSLTEATA